jgi:biotin operon repressor
MNPLPTSPFIPAWLDEAGLSQAEFRVFCHLCRRACNDAGVAWPSYDSIGEVCGMGRATVARCLRELEKRGLIVKDGKPFGGSSRYRITPPPTVSNEERLDDSNSLTRGTNEAPMVSPQNCNSASDETPIVSLEAREGYPYKDKKKNARCAPLPENLDTEEFRDEWEAWQQHRREKQKPLTPTAADRQLATLSGMGVTRAVAAIRHSLSNGWQGLFEPKADAPAKPTRELTSANAPSL